MGNPWRHLGCLMLAIPMLAQTAAPASLAEAKQELAAKHYAQAKVLFAAYAKAHPENVDAEVGVGDAELALHEYSAAELTYRGVAAKQPQMWRAHKNLVIIEARLGRWEEFDRERAVLRGARQREAAGISARESDVIDTFDVRGQHWIVREYYEPVGRSLTRFNFENFGTDGRVKAYLSLESAEDAKAALEAGDVLHSDETKKQVAVTDFALDWYNGASHGTIARYPKGEPSYVQVHGDVMRWLRSQPATAAR
jgi:tetratricopeptide (TPR) repeat protein